MKYLRIPLFGILIFVSVLASTSCHKSVSANRHQVHGVTYFMASGVGTNGDATRELQATDKNGRQKRSLAIAIPDMTVSLHDWDSNGLLASTTTDLSGYFQLPEQKPGHYRLCWEGAGWQSECLNNPVVIANHTYYANVVRVTPEKKDKMRPIVGSVAFRDGSLCRFLDVARRIDLTAHVSFKVNGEILASVRANTFGEFVFPSAPEQSVQVTASCGDLDPASLKIALDDWLARQPGRALMTGDSNILFAGNSSTGVAVAGPGLALVPVELPTSPPVLSAFAFFDGMREVNRAAPGTSVTIAALASGSVPLARLWNVGNGTVSAISDERISWQLPDETGSYIASVVLSDGRGGWRYESRVIEVTNDTRLVFSGKVRSALGTPPAGVRVSVNGNPLAIDTSGVFFGRIDPAADNRYVLNIVADEFVPISRVYHRESSGASYTLKLAESRSFNSSKGATVTFGGGREDNREGPPAIIRLSGNVLADSTGAPYNGQVNGWLAYIDPSQESLPGDYDAIGANGTDQSLISYGAIYVSLEDANGQPLRIAAGKSAQISVPIPPDRLANPSALPQSIPVWYYDEGHGMWNEEGTAQLVGAAYQATIKHFSTINMDVGTSGNAVCARVLVDFQKTPDNRILRMKLTLPNGGIQVKQAELDDKLNVVYRMLPDQDATFELLHNDGTLFEELVVKKFDGTGFVTVPDTINLTPADLMTGNDLWPPSPYSDCKLLVLVTGDVPTPGPFLSREGAADVSASAQGRSEAYYEIMDPNHERRTLEDWLTKNGFQPTAITGSNGFTLGAPDIIEVAYLNHGDLGSGRRMTCRKEAIVNVYCVVGNYTAAGGTNFDRDPAAALVAGTELVGTGFATVAMEHAPVDGFQVLGPVVKFFTYGNTGDYVTLAQLDSTSGDRLHPNVCMMCHGGDFPSTYTDASGSQASFPTSAQDVAALPIADKTAIINAIKAKESSFREFDLGNLTDLQGASADDTIKTLNCDYVHPTDPNSEIVVVIDAWYGQSCTGVGSTVQSEYLPWGLTVHPELYKNVVAKSCRTCHIAQENFHFNTFSDAAVSNDFSDVQPGGTYPYTCYHSMPNAEVTYNAFWVNKRQEHMDDVFGPC